MNRIDPTRDVLERAVLDADVKMEVVGPGNRVTVYRDNLGIPHTRAESRDDAFFGQGFVHARDRLWQMDYGRHRAMGKWASLAGPTELETDILFRKMGLAQAARNDYDNLGEQARKMLEAYAAGVNAFIHTGVLPAEYGMIGARPEPWQPWHSVAVYKVRHVTMGHWELKLHRARLLKGLGSELAAHLFPPYREGDLLIVPPGQQYQVSQALDVAAELARGEETLDWLSDDEGGSNNWAVSGWKTRSGKPLAAGDPHRPLDTPNVYYQEHVACPEFDAIGLSFPGVPGFPHFGHNARAAWCITHAIADTQDLFVEKFRTDEEGLKYLHDGTWVKADVSREIVEVRDGDLVEIEVVNTSHGPIIVGDPGQGWGLAFRFTATAEPDSTLDCFLPLLMAQSADDLEQAVRGWVDPVNSMTVADVDGAIGYRVRGRLPVRSGANAWIPVPGWTGDHEWEGHVPFEELPRIRDPREGFVATANNRIIGDDYPHYISHQFAPGFRIRRIADILSQGSDLQIEDMTRVHNDCTSLPALELLSVVQGIEPVDERTTRAREILLAWDGTMNRKLVAPTIYSAYRQALLDAIIKAQPDSLAQNLGPGPGASPRVMAGLRAHLPGLIAAGDPTWLPTGEKWEQILSHALAQALHSLEAEYGPHMDGWTWEKAHQTEHRHTLSHLFPESSHLLDPPPVGISGDGETVMAASYQPRGMRFAVTAASTARYAFDLADWDRSGWVVPLGSSGHPGSAHYTDQMEGWTDGRLFPMIYSWDRVIDEAVSTMELVPKS